MKTRMANSSGGRLVVLAVAGALMLAGCEPLSLTALGVGASAGVNHSLGGITYRTFTSPRPRVQNATQVALRRMGIKIASKGQEEGIEIINAQASGREIEIQLESLSPNTTRMRAVARNGLFYDSATSTEIILQTERALNQI